MKILILYFSGTGNTAYVADYIKARLNGGDIDLVSMEHFKKESAANYDALIFGFPVYDCRMPLFVREYLKDMATVKTKALFLFCTKAFFGGMALKSAEGLFRRLGYALMGSADITMPGSDGLAFLKKNSPLAR
jgi:flavodoxin